LQTSARAAIEYNKTL